jgi:hypothetical protein
VSLLQDEQELQLEHELQQWWNKPPKWKHPQQALADVCRPATVSAAAAATTKIMRFMEAFLQNRSNRG